jgi:YegS/Rv2252/BmrU family lipid kinase
MKNVLVVSNLNAGRKRAILYKRTIQKFLLKNSQSFKFITVDDVNNTDFQEFDTVLVIGGDGTVNKVIPKLIDTDKKLGIISCGTANLLAAKLGFSQNISKTLKILKEEKTKKIDVLKINDKYSILRFGLGYDADIIGKTPQKLKNRFGYFSYFIAGIIFALRLKNKEYEIEIDGITKKINSSGIIVANAANMYKNLISISKNSKLDDGYFEIFILKTQNPIIYFIEFIKIVLGIKNSNIIADYIKTNNLKIKTNYCFAHIDGEKTKFTQDLSFDILKERIAVYYGN